MTVTNVKGIDLIATVSTVPGNPNLLSAPSVAGKSTTVGNDYQVGIPNYSVLGVNATGYKDPLTGDAYPIAVTTRGN